MTDEKIIQKLKEKKQKALEAAISRYGGYVFTVVRNILGDMSSQDAEETVADVFIRLWNHAECLDSDKPIKPYLVAIARNTAKNKRREICNTCDFDELDMPVECDADEVLVKSEKLEIVEKALSQADEADREIFIRYYYNYEKVREIANRLNLTESAVKMRLLRIRKFLAQALKERGYIYEN